MHGSIMVTSYSRMYFILTQDVGDLLRRLQGNRSKYIGMCTKQIWITTQIHIVLNKTADIIYIRRVRGRTFPSGLFLAGNYPIVCEVAPVYIGIITC